MTRSPNNHIILLKEAFCVGVGELLLINQIQQP